MSIQFPWSLRLSIQWTVVQMMAIAPLRTVQLGSYTRGAMTDCRSELDSHADTSGVGDNAVLLIQDYDQAI